MIHLRVGHFSFKRLHPTKIPKGNIAEDEKQKFRYNKHFFGLQYRWGCGIVRAYFFRGVSAMKMLEDRIRLTGKVCPGDVLKVNDFLNHQIDVPFIKQLGQEFFRLYQDCAVNKILTIEASGIGVACLTAQFFNCPVLFAKKAVTSNMGPDVYTAPVHSYTHNIDGYVYVNKEFLSPHDHVLIIDDFLANGCALEAMTSICKQAQADLVGCGIVIEKAYQPGGDEVRRQGIRVESLARIKSMSVENGIEFCH
jgi:xanthine phosphoribosyltransferase